LVQGHERRADAEARRDWLGAPCHGEDEQLSPRLRALLGEHWTQAALMEHASIAAFARFSLQLLALGAPAELVGRAAQAMADETEHARACFALATRYTGQNVGPGLLAIQGCLDGADPVAIFSTAVREACIGETLAAMEAQESARQARKPALRATLTRIAEDEERHAELGFRFAAWMLETSEGKLRAQLLSVLEQVVFSELESRAEQPCAEASDRELLSDHGMLAPSTRAALRDRTLREVVVPCAARLLGQPLRGQRKRSEAAMDTREG
jgi:hypothetical protein